MFELIGAVIGWIWNGIQAITTAIVYGLVAAWHFLAAFAGDIWSAAKWSYQTILKPIGLFVDKIYKRAVDLYDHYVQPAIDWLKRVTAVARKLYFTLLAPILSTIDGVQKVLKLLELLHVQWAADLDKALAELERKLSLPLQTAIHFVNGIINRVESYVLTAENLFQQVTHLNTLRRDLGAVQNIQWNSLLRNVKTELAKNPWKAATLAPPGHYDSILDAHLAGEANVDGVDVSALVQFFDERTAQT